MRDEELKKMLYDSYHTEPSESGKRFIRAYSKRKLSIPTLLLMQLKYMWIQYILILLFLTGVIVYLAVFAKPEYVKVISSLSPLPLGSSFLMFTFSVGLKMLHPAMVKQAARAAVHKNLDLSTFFITLFPFT